jgi:hypothetical protein
MSGTQGERRAAVTSLAISLAGIVWFCWLDDSYSGIPTMIIVAVRLLTIRLATSSRA